MKTRLSGWLIPGSVPPTPFSLKIDKTDYNFFIIGEFHIHNPIDTDSDVIQATVQMAMKEGLYIHVHTNHEAVEKLFELEPDLKVLWAHAGMACPASRRCGSKNCL